MSNLDMIRGRQVVAYLTNKSGGAVVAGDVVIMDGSNDESFTTTTSASSLKKIGVAQESIANNAAGRVLVSGYASLVNVSASATRDYYLFTHTVAKQATSSATFSQGAFGHVIKAGTSPSALIYDETAQSSASSAYSGVAWSSGTSMPGSPSTNQRITRTDIMGGLDCEYDGTRWRSVQIFTGDPNNQAFIPLSADGNVWGAGLWQPTYSVYLLDFRGTTYVATTNDGSKYWTVALTNYLTGATIASFTTAADTASTATNHVVAVNAVSSAQTIGLNVGKTSTPGSIYPLMNFTYQLIVT